MCLHPFSLAPKLSAPNAELTLKQGVKPRPGETNNIMQIIIAKKLMSQKTLFVFRFSCVRSELRKRIRIRKRENSVTFFSYVEWNFLQSLSVSNGNFFFRQSSVILSTKKRQLAWLLMAAVKATRMIRRRSWPRPLRPQTSFQCHYLIASGFEVDAEQKWRTNWRQTDSNWAISHAIVSMCVSAPRTGVIEEREKKSKNLESESYTQQ